MTKKIASIVCVLFFTLSTFAQVDKIVGRWKTIDDADGSTKSIVHIFKATNGKYYGKVEKLFKNPDKKCTECEGANKDKAVLGMMVINGMVEKEGTLTGGTILDPNNGKIYSCNINYDSKTGKLNVKGSLDKRGWIGRTQIWIKE
jgi:uncharacterized protein (DUF2147 family)